MKRYISGFLLMASLTIGCNSANNESTADLGSSSNTAAAIPVSTSSGSVPSGIVKHPPTKLGSLMNMGSQSNTFTTASSGLNPAHGMPGHTCALPVGAPLNGGTAQPQASQPVEVSAQEASATQPTLTLPQPNFKMNSNVAINPAHGEPGHDCSIAVGAPLAKKEEKKEVKINPAHGEPGHDCSIAVGAPLPG